MGQAKRRGTYEQRVAQAIAKQNAALLQEPEEDKLKLEAIRNNPAVITSKICGHRMPMAASLAIAAMLGTTFRR